MAADLAALAPSAIICAAFLVGAWLLLRKELAPKRRARGKDAARQGDGRQPAGGQGKSLYFIASADYGVRSAAVSAMRAMKSSDVGKFARSVQDSGDMLTVRLLPDT